MPQPDDRATRDIGRAPHPAETGSAEIEPQLFADWPNDTYSSFVHVGNMRWHVQRAGDGPVLLLIHGAGASTHSWRELFLPLARHFDVVAFDLPGHAFSSSLVPSAAGIGGYAHAVGALLRAMNLHVDLVAGHSAGAALACQLALDGLISPQEIVSMNGAFFPPFGVAGRLLAPLTRRLAASRTLARHLTSRLGGSRENITRLIQSTGSKISPEGVELYVRLAQLPNHVNGVLSMMAAWDLDELLRRLPRLGVPLQMLCAENDRMVPPVQARRLERSVPCATVKLLADLGHLAHEEQPALFVELLRQRREIAVRRKQAQSP